MNALQADPRSVDLRSLAPHFYRLGVRILELFEEEEMVDILIEVPPPYWVPRSRWELPPTFEVRRAKMTHLKGLLLYRPFESEQPRSPITHIIRADL
jgi:hypothetical protein